MRAPASRFSTLSSVGGLLPPDLLTQISAGTTEGLTPGDFDLPAGERLNEVTARAWERAKSYWAAFKATRESLSANESGVTETREQWLLPLFRELGYGRLTFHAAAEELGDRRYQISHRAGEGLFAPPVNLVSFQIDLDRVTRSDGQGRSSPHGAMQEFLNRTDHEWGIVSNGLRLRLLRDNLTLSRAAYVEFDLATMLDGGVYSDFVMLFLLCHRSRLPVAGDSPERDDCWLERWRSEAESAGKRSLDNTRVGVEAAIKALGQGFPDHPANEALRGKLASGELSVQAYYRQLLRVVYRLLFLFAAEDRHLLFDASARPDRQKTYLEHYGIGRLRELVEQRRRFDRHDDLWRSMQLTFRALTDPDLGAKLDLKPLAGGLFGPASCPDLDDCQISNQKLLTAISGLAHTAGEGQAGLRRTNYRDMDVEELGSVYESLLDQQPEMNTSVNPPVFNLGHSGERKSTGSYYTNRGLVRELIVSALEPVISEAIERGATPAEQRANLLALKVCDPACGSGHFLLAAARRIGREVARIDAGESEPGPREARAAIREVIAHSVYGVDLNPLAVDLCKLALWLEAHDAGKPIGFLDHHIRHGNALIGATREAMAGGVPDDVFEPVTGDDRPIASAVKRRNRQERLNYSYDTLSQIITVFGSAEEATAYFRTMDQPEDSLDAVAAREREYQRRSATAGSWRARLRADLWTAAAFWPLRAGEPEAPTQATWLNLAGDPRLVDYLRADKREELGHLPAFKTVRLARQLAKRHSFFHWELEFDDVFTDERSGFDCFLANPPWERIKLQEQEFFAARNQSIATAPNAAARKRLIAALETSSEPSHRRLFEEFEQEKRKAESESIYLRKAGQYPLTGRGDVNTYSVFSERMVRQTNSEGGRAGIIVPTGIATDDTNKHFFGWLVSEGRIASLFDFENSQAIFPGVHRSYKFSLLTMLGAARPAAPFRVGFFLTQPEQIGDPERTFELDAATIALLNPNTRTCPIFRTDRDAELTKKIYRAAPVLIREDETGQEISNPWGIKFKTMFHMSNDSHLFRTREQLENRGLTLHPDGRFRNQEETWERLYQGMMFQSYDHRAADIVHSAQAQQRQNQPSQLSDEDHQDPNRVAIPMYWVKSDDVEERLGDYGRKWGYAFANVTSPTNATTFRGAIIPFCGAGNSAQLILLNSTLPPGSIQMLVGNLSCMSLDYIAKQKVGGVNLNFFFLKQFPIIDPSRQSGETIQLISDRVLELVYTAEDLRSFAIDCGYYGDPFPWNVVRRTSVYAELDAIFATLYKLSRSEYEFVLDRFPILNRNDVSAYGEYRTKRLCLEAYDRLAESDLFS